MTFLVLTKEAISKIKELQAKHADKPHALRVKVSMGGCNGFEYHFDMEAIDTATDRDVLLNEEDAICIVDIYSKKFLEGATLHYKITLFEEAFEIQNPNVDSSCGCGNSFSISFDKLK